eukprot:scaffold7416_cov390-Prasinococcus_capsulatus_cf.AAC.5
MMMQRRSRRGWHMRGRSPSSRNTLGPAAGGLLAGRFGRPVRGPRRPPMRTAPCGTLVEARGVGISPEPAARPSHTSILSTACVTRPPDLCLGRAARVAACRRAWLMGVLADITTVAQFDALLDDESQAEVVVHFWAAWCEACAQLDKVCETLAVEYTGTKFVRVNAEEDSTLPVVERTPGDRKDGGGRRACTCAACQGSFAQGHSRRSSSHTEGRD